mmetsp:Transcript_12889/g.24127  ORF Transcript_12889/g.24127 Transcript_12889/m.24127 type:complete len:107 (-) Transcript_12889:1000-1320(-)
MTPKQEETNKPHTRNGRQMECHGAGIPIQHIISCEIIASYDATSVLIGKKGIDRVVAILDFALDIVHGVDRSSSSAHDGHDDSNNGGHEKTQQDADDGVGPGDGNY